MEEGGGRGMERGGREGGREGGRMIGKTAGRGGEGKEGDTRDLLYVVISIILVVYYMYCFTCSGILGMYTAVHLHTCCRCGTSHGRKNLIAMFQPDCTILHQAVCCTQVLTVV